MTRYKNLVRYLLLTLFIIVMISGCSSPFSPQDKDWKTDIHSIDLGQAKYAHVQIEMDAGDLAIDSGTTKLMEGNFDYLSDRRRAEVNYRVDGSEGDLRISHPDESSSLFNRENHHRWNLHLSDSVPIELEIFTGAGNSDLDFSDIDLLDLHIETGAGNGKIDLSGTRSHDLSVKIMAGIGNITVILPRDVGVRVNVQSGIGNVDMAGFSKDGDVYTNDAFGESSETVEVDIEAGIGAVKIQLQ